MLLGYSIAESQTDTVKILSDSASFNSINKIDTLSSINLPKVSTNFQPTKSPLLAMGFSAILPGTGQIYDENYWKTPIIWGVGGYWVYQWIDLNKKYKNFRSLNSLYPDAQYVRLRDYYSDERDKFAWFLGALYILNIVDAYAGAHLYDFDVSPDLTSYGRMVPRVTASVRLRF